MGKRIIRDRPLTDEEKAKYRQIRRQVADELPDIRQQAKAAKPRIQLNRFSRRLGKSENDRA